MFQDVLARVAESFSGERARALVADLWAIDRWFDFAHFKRSASYSAEKMAEAGLDQVEVLSFAADGRTAYGDWVAPLAWDVTKAELELRSPQRLPVCSYQELPVSLAMWSAPTPAGGVEAEVVLLDEWEGAAGPIETQAPDPRLRNKILFGSRPGPELKRLAARHGALGVISQHHAAYGSWPAAPAAGQGQLDQRVERPSFRLAVHPRRHACVRLLAVGAPGRRADRPAAEWAARTGVGARGCATL